jgi:hypothetical protein
VITTGLLWLALLHRNKPGQKLRSEPCVDLAAHLPFLHGRNLLRLLWESPLLVRSRGNAILSAGESTILALKPFATVDRERAETATADVKPNIEKIGSEYTYIQPHSFPGT